MARILRAKVMWIIPSLEHPHEFDMRAFSAETGVVMREVNFYLAMSIVCAAPEVGTKKK